MKALNLYAGLGGNRRKWSDFNVNVTAVENNAGIAAIYQDMFPDDRVIVGDAHEYLLEHYMEYDFIWSSPPCPTHSRYRHSVGFIAKGFKAVYPDMTLYQEIILLKHHFYGKWVVENTVSYYDPLIPPLKVGRHYMWSNFDIPNIKVGKSGIGDMPKIKQLEELSGYDLSGYKIANKRQMLRNLVSPEVGRHVLECAIASE